MFFTSVIFDLAAVVFMGTLSGRGLETAAENAVNELTSRGYVTPTLDNPVKVYPVQKNAGEFSGAHAGGWKPGAIFLRVDPNSAFTEENYLRHELMHEANFRTCKGKLASWADEASAVAFSGEADVAGPEVEGNLIQLVKKFGWPLAPCAVSSKIAGMLSAKNEPTFSYVLVNLLSGRIEEAFGKFKKRDPFGSLLKLPYAASLSGVDAKDVGAALRSSDTDTLLGWRSHISFESYQNFTGIKSTSPKDLQGWKSLLGEKDSSSQYVIEEDLTEIAKIVRSAVLSDPQIFESLSEVTSDLKGTLFKTRDDFKDIFSRISAIGKTGTISDSNGNPEIGYLAIAWPKHNPQMLAVFKKSGVRGTAVAEDATPVLRNWNPDNSKKIEGVELRFLSLIPRKAWSFSAFTKFDPTCRLITHSKRTFSTCGGILVKTTAMRARPERVVFGVLEEFENGEVYLHTDTNSYVDAVLKAEGIGLPKAAREVLAAIILSNSKTERKLCDTTHCMVFQGILPSELSKNYNPIRVSADLISLIDKNQKLCTGGKSNWISFAKGGEEQWEKTILAHDVAAAVKENLVLDVRRNRARNGQVTIKMKYASGEEELPCEIFRNTLKLPSCPQEIKSAQNGSAWKFSGIGAGHGSGLSLNWAASMAQQGKSAHEILGSALENCALFR